jgi:poly [ADP-ribose] polymerase 2/3/4
MHKKQTGNDFKSIDREKKRGKYVHLDNDYQEYNAERKLGKYLGFTKLEPSVRGLIEIMFNVKMMQQTLMEFEIDKNVLPLGLMSQCEVLKKETKPNHPLFIHLTNQFCSKIPHGFGEQKPTLINRTEVLSKKIELLREIRQVEIAYKLCKCGANPLNENYTSLETNITSLDPSSKEYKMINEYATSTFVNSHVDFKVEINENFKLNKSTEVKRFKAYTSLPNQMLLF